MLRGKYAIREKKYIAYVSIWDSFSIDITNVIFPISVGVLSTTYLPIDSLLSLLFSCDISLLYRSICVISLRIR